MELIIVFNVLRVCLPTILFVSTFLVKSVPQTHEEFENTHKEITSVDFAKAYRKMKKPVKPVEPVEPVAVEPVEPVAVEPVEPVAVEPVEPVDESESEFDDEIFVTVLEGKEPLSLTQAELNFISDSPPNDGAAPGTENLGAAPGTENLRDYYHGISRYLPSTPPSERPDVDTIMAIIKSMEPPTDL